MQQDSLRMVKQPWHGTAMAVGALCTALLMVWVGLCLLILQPRPEAQADATLSSSDLRAAHHLVNREAWQRVLHGAPLQLTLTSGQAHALVENVGSRLLKARAGLKLKSHEAELVLSMPMQQGVVRAMVPHNSWLNVRIHLDAQSNGPPRLTQVDVGHLPIPPWVATWALRRMAQAYGIDELAELGLAAVQQTRISTGHVSATLRWHPALRARASALLFPPDMTEAIARAHQRLADYLRHEPRGAAPITETESLPLAQLLAALHTQAQQRSLQLALTSSDSAWQEHIARDNRATLLVLCVYANRMSVGALLPAARNWTPLPARTLTLHGREDWAQHYLTSAVLATDLGSRVSDLIGMYKELLDAVPQGTGSGFSFNDLAADKAGVRLGRLAIQNPMALQTRLAKLHADTDLLPEVSDLPEFLTEAQLQQRFGGTDGRAFQAMLSEIERRISQTPALL